MSTYECIQNYLISKLSSSMNLKTECIQNYLISKLNSSMNLKTEECIYFETNKYNQIISDEVNQVE